MDKFWYVFNRVGVNEMYSKEDVGVEMVKEEEWDEVDVESEIVKRYWVFDGVGRIEVDESYSEEEVLCEIDKIDKIVWE